MVSFNGSGASFNVKEVHQDLKERPLMVLSAIGFRLWSDCHGLVSSGVCLFGQDVRNGLLIGSADISVCFSPSLRRVGDCLMSGTVDCGLKKRPRLSLEGQRKIVGWRGVLT